MQLLDVIRIAVECSATDIFEEEITLRPELLEVEGADSARSSTSRSRVPRWLPAFVSADSLNCKAGEMKLRVAVRSSRLGTSSPVTGGFSGFSIGAFWPKAGAGVVSGWDGGLFWAAAQTLMPKNQQRPPDSSHSCHAVHP